MSDRETKHPLVGERVLRVWLADDRKAIRFDGACVIDYRNESNGYYGGDLVWPGKAHHFYGGVYGQNVSTERWVEAK